MLLGMAVHVIPALGRKDRSSRSASYEPYGPYDTPSQTKPTTTTTKSCALVGTKRSGHLLILW